MTENSYKILQYLQTYGDSTAIDIAEALNLEKRRVDSYFSAGIAKADLGMRDLSVSPAVLRLTDAGKSYTK
jgi:hypothetical protein